MLSERRNSARVCVDSRAEVVIPQELTEKVKKRVDKVEQSVILDIMETKIAESEIVKSIEDYLDGCSKQELLDLHNFIFSEYISDIEDVEWGE